MSRYTTRQVIWLDLRLAIGAVLIAAGLLIVGAPAWLTGGVLIAAGIIFVGAHYGAS